ncbi:hypothetical protein [Streptomyces sp. NBC_01766]|uniref:hypothetical protein n=1 Tax=Streptomyces sp. NBC_01766 TaxID=2975936 RepID=UPI002DD88E75|nr:hypothetical protein [Streptomyces sp. NBC_01766]WSC22106.1 hypothetical protein OIE60_21780 [Streptomyces sp. NBC_01766]
MPGIDECLLEAMRLPGALGAGVVDWTSGLTLGTIGQSPNDDHEATAAETAELARMAAEHPAFRATAFGATAFGATDFGATAPAGSGESGDGSGDGNDGGLSVEDVIVTTRTGYHLLHFVETTFDSSVFLHLWLNRDEGNLALARLRLRDLAERLVL